MRSLAPLLAAICILLPAAAHPQPKREALLAEWRAAVASHKTGTLDDAAERIGTWSSADLRQVYAALQLQLRAHTVETDRLLILGAMLHADIAILSPRRAITIVPGDRFVSQSVDGRDSGQQVREPGWEFSGQLLADVSRTPDLQFIVKLWFRATASHMLKYAHLADLGTHLDLARRLFPDDPDLMFDTGCFYESLASPRAQAAIADTFLTSGRVRVEVAPLGSTLEKADTWYSRVLAVAPGHQEARVHRGRVRILRGRARDAIADLAAVSNAVTEPYVKYNALLFLGGAYEALERTDEARKAYERAAALYIYAQSPRIALSRLATRRGDMPAAQRHIREVLRLAPDAPDRGDPFWSYYDGSGRVAAALMSSLRDAVANLRGAS